VVPIPPHEPAATLARWEAVWRAIDDPMALGGELSDGDEAVVIVLADRLARFGVRFTPEMHDLLARIRRGVDRHEAEVFDDDEGIVCE
jgi:hypothetical protein